MSNAEFIEFVISGICYVAEHRLRRTGQGRSGNRHLHFGLAAGGFYLDNEWYPKTGLMNIVDKGLKRYT